MRSLRTPSTQTGQGTVEMVLILVALLGIATLIATTFKEKQLFAQMVESPWAQISGMLQAGVWSSPERARAQHPHSRILSVQGDLVQ